ncbi:MAG: ral nucleoside transport system ATP-binding protein [Deferribacteres bacterium]|jgi:simple sugar transport system ATP-binding protein|nr:ral nucleoside transport system ATP-binding protein [Deferribacteres bacterium]
MPGCFFEVLMSSCILKIENITKSFAGFIANKNVNLEIFEGEIHTILGENGAGKSTLMNILTGLYRPDSGNIYINGTKVTIKSPKDALKYQIGMVHQHFMLVNNISVFENLLLSMKLDSFVINERKLKSKVKEILREFELDIDIEMPVWKLSIGQQQWVELIKLLIRDSKILILDEPTAVLTPQESEFLFTFLTKLKSQNKAIIFISHKMKEVMTLSDKVTILKKGETVKTLNRGEFDEQLLAELMISNKEHLKLEKSAKVFSKQILKIKNLNVKNDKGLSDLSDFSLELFEGEILGIAGITGNGQKALAEVLTGLKKPLSGQIIVNDQDITYSTSKSKYISGIAHIPEDRKTMGIAPDLSVDENLILKNYSSDKFTNFFFLNKEKIKQNAREQIEKYSIKMGYDGIPVRLLSGGNIQKVIIARELSENPLILVALYPTRGLDVGSAEYVHQVILDSREKGMSTILISEDLDELLKISDRIAVMFRGKNMGYLSPESATKTEIGLLMSGKK